MTYNCYWSLVPFFPLLGRRPYLEFLPAYFDLIKAFSSFSSLFFFFIFLVCRTH
jgi:hypothetical protein